MQLFRICHKQDGQSKQLRLQLVNNYFIACPTTDIIHKTSQRLANISIHNTVYEYTKKHDNCNSCICSIFQLHAILQTSNIHKSLKAYRIIFMLHIRFVILNISISLKAYLNYTTTASTAASSKSPSFTNLQQSPSLPYQSPLLQGSLDTVNVCYIDQACRPDMWTKQT